MELSIIQDNRPPLMRTKKGSKSMIPTNLLLILFYFSYIHYEFPSPPQALLFSKHSFIHGHWGLRTLYYLRTFLPLPATSYAPHGRERVEENMCVWIAFAIISMFYYLNGIRSEPTQDPPGRPCFRNFLLEYIYIYFSKSVEMAALLSV